MKIIKEKNYFIGIKISSYNNIKRKKKIFS